MARLRATVLGFAVAAASAAPPGHVAFAETAKAAPQPRSSAIVEVTTRVAADLAASAKDAVVFAGPLQSDEGAPRATELVAKLGALVAGALGPGTISRPEPVALSVAQSLGRKAKTIVYFNVEIARGELRLTADVYRPASNVWDRVRGPASSPLAHAFASARIDAEVRGYLAPVPLVGTRIDRAAAEDRDVLAVACGDLDSDGSLELAVVSRRRVSLGRLRAGRFVPSYTALLRDLSPVAPAPLREPIAGAVIVPRAARPGFLDVGITDRAHGSRLDDKLRPLATLSGVPFATPEGDACLSFQGTTVGASVGKCADSDPASAPVDLGPAADALASATIIGRDGAVRVVQARHDPLTLELQLRASAETAVVPRSGAQVALADLDGDGDPEVISTLDVLPSASTPAARGAVDRAPPQDAVVISSWHPGRPPTQRARVPVPSGVRAVAACPPDAPGPAPVVVATAGELWIVR